MKAKLAKYHAKQISSIMDEYDGVTVADLHEISGLSRVAIYDAIGGKGNPRCSTLDSIYHAISKATGAKCDHTGYPNEVDRMRNDH